MSRTRDIELRTERRRQRVVMNRLELPTEKGLSMLMRALVIVLFALGIALAFAGCGGESVDTGTTDMALLSPGSPCTSDDQCALHDGDATQTNVVSLCEPGANPNVGTCVENWHESSKVCDDYGEGPTCWNGN